MTQFLPLGLLSAVAPSDADGAGSALVAIAPGAIALAVVLVLLTAACAVALVLEIRRDGYGLERPTPMSPENPWQVTWAPRRRARAAGPWGIRRVQGAARR